MELKLILAKGEPKGKEIVINKFPATIGRDPGCDVVIASPKVSRKHCRLEDRGGRVTLVDGGSGNGTFVNGQKIAQPTALSAGDKVVVGPLGFVVRLGGDVGSTDFLSAAAAAPASGGDLNDFLASLEAGGAPAKNKDDDDVIQLTDDDLK